MDKHIAITVRLANHVTPLIYLCYGITAEVLMKSNTKLALVTLLAVATNLILEILLLGVFSIVFSKVSSCSLRNFLVYMWCFVSIVSPIYCAVLTRAMCRNHAD